MTTDNDALVHELNNLPMVGNACQFDGWLLSNRTLEAILAALRSPAPVVGDLLSASNEELIAQAQPLDLSEAARPQPAQDAVEAIAKRIVDTAIHRLRNLHDYAGRPAWDQVVAEELTNAITALRQHNDIASVTAPWADFHGDLPDYDHPMRPVYESGIQYAVNLLAKTLDVEDYEVCDGTEEFDGDLGGTLFNVVLGAMPKDKDGDPIHPKDLRQHSGESSLREAVKVLRDGYADAVAGYEYIKQVHGRLDGVGFDRVTDHFFQWVTMPEREGLLAGSHTVAALGGGGEA